MLDYYAMLLYIGVNGGDMGKPMTDKQFKIFAFIREFIDARGFPPTMRDIGQTFGITPKGAYDHIKAIEKKGFVSCSPKTARGIQVCDGRPNR